MWAGPRKVLFLKQPHFHMAKSHYGSWGLGGAGGGGGGAGGGGKRTYSQLITIKIVWGCVRATRSLHDEVPRI